MTHRVRRHECYLTLQTSNAFSNCFSEIADFAAFSFALISLAAILRDNCTVNKMATRLLRQFRPRPHVFGVTAERARMW